MIKEIACTTNNNKRTTYNGVEYNSISSACRELGLNEDTIATRMRRRNISFEEAVNSYGVNFEGTRYKSINELCTNLDLNRSVLVYALNKGDTLEEAVSRLHTDRKIYYNDEVYNSLIEACKAHDINYAKAKHDISMYGDSFESLVIENIFEKYQGYFTVKDPNKPIHTKEGIFHICTCNKCEFKAILRADMMKKHVEGCYEKE